MVVSEHAATVRRPVLSMAGITKSFSGVCALKDVDFEVYEGSVHALIGENGAGKSTLMNVLAGRFNDYTGSIQFRGRNVRITHPRQALGIGIGVIYQEASVLPNLTVAENIMLGHEPRGRLPGILDRRALNRDAQRALDLLRLELPIEEAVERLSTAQQCLVEIARALRTDARLLVFDEPTASLGSEDVEKLFHVIRDLKERGIAIVYISHRLAELPRIADRVTVLRDGRRVGTQDMAVTKPAELTTMMLGRRLADVFPQRAKNPREPVLKVSGLTRPGIVHDVSFELHAGEILGIAGLTGSGRTEIIRAVLGADPASGVCEFKNRRIGRRSPSRCKRLGIAMVPEDRARDGIIAGRPLQENISVGILDRLSNAWGFLSPGRVRADAGRMIQQMEIQPPIPRMEIQRLSGGNQQKAIVGRILAADPKVILFDEPTQGIDMGAKAQLYHLMADLANEGRALILVSSEPIELANLADRVLVVHDGRIVDELCGSDLDEDALFAACIRERPS